MATAKPRAARAAAPGARRIVFTGVMAVPDDYGRLRIILLERFADGAPDSSWAMLARELPKVGPDYSVPYEIQPADDETRGIVRVTVPARHRKHWGPVAESLRGREVRVEATVRPFRFAKPQEGGGEAEYAAGVALDLAMLEARAPAHDI